MISFKLNSQPFHPTQKSKYFQKKDENVKTNEISNDIKSKEKKVVNVTTVYCSNYLKMFKQYNTELPSDFPKEHLDYIKRTQQHPVELSKEIPSSFSSLKSLSEINERNKMNKTQQRKEFHSSQKKEIHSASFTKRNYNQKGNQKRESNKIDTLKPIPLYHSHLLSHNTNNSQRNSNEDFPEIIHKEKHAYKDDKDEEEEIQSFCAEKRRISREKQIFFGKNTNEYQNYLSVIPKEERRISDPKTPDIESSLSKRKWDRTVRRWRRSLHAFDNVNEQNQVELARALAFRLQNEENPKKTMVIYSSLPYSSYLVDE